MSEPDINDLELLDEPVEVTGQVGDEEFFLPPLPDDGEHTATLALGDRGIRVDRRRDKATGKKTGVPFLNVHLALTLVDDAGNKTGMAFDQVTSLVMQVGTSKLHAILGLTGNPAPPRTTLGELKTLAEAVLAQAPRVGVVTQWEARTNHGTDAAPDYVTLAKGQRKFLFNEETQKYNPEILDPATNESVRANVRVVRYKHAS